MWIYKDLGFGHSRFGSHGGYGQTWDFMSNHDDTVMSSWVKNDTKFRLGWRRPQQPREAGWGCNKGGRDTGVRRGAGLRSMLVIGGQILESLGWWTRRAGPDHDSGEDKSRAWRKQAEGQTWDRFNMGDIGVFVEMSKGPPREET